MTLTSGGPPFPRQCPQLWWAVPAGLCPPPRALLMWPSQQLTENSGSLALGTRPLTLRAFFLLSASSQWAGSLHRLPWQREDGSAVPRTDVTEAKMNVVGAGSVWQGPRGMGGGRIWS